MKPKEVIIGLVSTAVLVGGLFFLLSKTTHPETTTLPLSQGQTQTNSNTEATANAIAIKGFAFNPTPIKVKKGTTVTWTNQDDAHHTITADAGSPSGGPASELLAKGQSYSLTFNTTGTFKYHCEPHPYMHGTVEVTE